MKRVNKRPRKQHICYAVTLTTEDCPFKILSIVGEGLSLGTHIVQSYIAGTNERILFTAETKPCGKMNRNVINTIANWNHIKLIQMYNSETTFKYKIVVNLLFA